METLPRKFKRAWIAALRSGEFRQGTGKLLRYGTYCCLGVACKVAGVPDNEIEYMGQVNLPLLNEYQIPNVLGVGTPLANSLVNMNDTRGFSFLEIANFIEQNIPDTEENDELEINELVEPDVITEQEFQYELV